MADHLPGVRQLVAALLLACVTGWASAAADPALEARVTHISERLRCLVCQNQSIAESNADLANDLRDQVREMLVAGKSENDVLDFMVERYGKFVLYDPPLDTSTLLLWGGPAALMLAALGGFAWTVRTRRRQEASAALTEQDHARARALLNDKNENPA